MASEIQDEPGGSIGGHGLSRDQVQARQQRVRRQEQRVILPGAIDDAEIVPGILVYPLHARAGKNGGKLADDLCKKVIFHVSSYRLIAEGGKAPLCSLLFAPAPYGTFMILCIWGIMRTSSIIPRTVSCSLMSLWGKGAPGPVAGCRMSGTDLSVSAMIAAAALTSSMVVSPVTTALMKTSFPKASRRNFRCSPQKDRSPVAEGSFMSMLTTSTWSRSSLIASAWMPQVSR